MTERERSSSAEEEARPATPSSPEAPLEIGAILRPHGLRGEVKVKLHYAESDALHHVEHVLLESPRGQRSQRRIAAVRGTGKGLLLHLDGVDDCDGAEALRGHRLLVERAALPPLEPGEYYLADLVGCTVHVAASDSGEGRVIGVVRQVRPDPSVDTLVIEDPEGRLLEQPIGDAWVASVDVGSRRVELSTEDGLIR